MDSVHDSNHNYEQNDHKGGNNMRREYRDRIQRNDMNDRSRPQMPDRRKDPVKERLANVSGPTTNLQIKEGNEPKKFTGRCRLFVGNLPNTITEEEFTAMFKPYGETAEVFLNISKGFGFVKLDTRQHAEAAKAALDFSLKDGKYLRVRFATHGAALKVKNLNPWVSNELLETAFSIFGDVERAVVIVDDRGRPVGEGIVEYARKQSAQQALKRCTDGCFILTRESREERRKDDKLAPIRELCELFIAKCSSLYTPGTNCTIDESLLNFRGRCGFKQYIPNKPAKYGIKVFVLADSATYYFLTGKICIGKDSNYDPNFSVPTNVVLELVKPIENTNRNITTDNCSLRPVLVEPLEQRDEEDGLPEKNFQKNMPEYQKEREMGPRLAEPGSFEFDYANRWKQLYKVEKQKRDNLDKEIMASRRRLDEQMEDSLYEHETNMLREKLRQLEEQSTYYQREREMR
ncbi:PSPC1 [Cordylochernes scorpioides]|uniref:PSPC1 n=1 Tax=Cordylochernes scorpioides TaxID=51811 RepID=A0ABY6K052_9ARAC|nr:PSPC1 [Cordylochernes scorpioides]